MYNEIIETKLFFIAVVNSSLKQFTGGYAHYPTLESLKGLDIYIPQYNNGQNAYQFMNDFIMALQVEPIVNLYEYLQLKGLIDTKLSEKERTAIEQLEQGKVSFEWFDVVDIFNVKNTFNILSRDIISDSGNTPYLSASKENNAVSTYISYDQRFLDKGNCIFIGGKTFVVTYQAQDFFSNDSHNLCLHLKNKEIATKLIQLFMKTCLEKGLGHKYSWGNSISSKKIQSDKLLLPIKDNIIDYPYMEILMSALQKGVLKEVMFWIKTQYGDLKINL
ncbi:hypothetical protein PTQ27_00890 [Mannheimia sp. AT1]|uniref:Type I restriction modification DNA specificity domain-containing protein n=2 Tax=Mannheimia cairinae TaxID=3025936 RepID=A0ABT5MN75_9PAST|nr:restriction endonuclease subunit S [Mannheimia cairinae]MDD0823031.1 hypothetical protein [Mannheimia cairinae]MDD0825944.1 hypothetical protein [Mannheimia cairinae]